MIFVRTYLKFVSSLNVIVRAIIVIIWRWYLIVLGIVLALIVISSTVLISLVEVVLALILVLVMNRIILSYQVGPLNSVIDIIARCWV